MSKILNKGLNSTKNNKNISIEKKNTLGKNNNNNKKVIHKDESDSKPEIKESQYVLEEDDDIEEEKKRGEQPPQKRREISDKVFLGNTVSPPFDDAGRSSAIDRTALNYNDAKEKVKKVSYQYWEI